MDQVNQRFGIQEPISGLHQVLQRAPMRIAFNRIPNVTLEGLSEKDNRPPPSTSPLPGKRRSWGSRQVYDLSAYQRSDCLCMV